MSFRQLVFVFALITGVASTGCTREPTFILTYELVDPIPGHVGDDGATMIEDAINHRIKHRGHANSIHKRRFEVALYEKLDAPELKLIEQLIGAQGGFEFRILADPEHESDLTTIKEAKATPPGKHDVVVESQTVAAWVPYGEKAFGPADRETAGMVKRQAAGVAEALVLIDDLNVTGEYLTSAKRGVDPGNHPNIQFSLNEDGAEKLKQLTSDNLPEPSRPDAFRKLGILFDGKLVTAPAIRSEISKSGAISCGTLSEREVENMIAVLDAGSLPCRIRLVDEKRVAK